MLLLLVGLAVGVLAGALIVRLRAPEPTSVAPIVLEVDRGVTDGGGRKGEDGKGRGKGETDATESGQREPGARPAGPPPAPAGGGDDPDDPDDPDDSGEPEGVGEDD